MKKIFFALILLLGFLTNAQHTISGTFTPAKDYSWIIAYHLKPGSEVYRQSTPIKNGSFEFKFPASSPSGIYRLVYALPQDEFYIDAIYTGKEDVKFKFDTTKGLAFTASKDNILFNTYFKEINQQEQKIIDLYSKGNPDVDEVENNFDKLRKIQSDFDDESEGLMVNQFIKANQPYIPYEFEAVQDYVKNKKSNYFKHLTLDNPTIQASGFLTNKLSNYVFTALPIQRMTNSETETVMQENTHTLDQKLKDASDIYKFHIYYSIWKQAVANNLDNTSDFIYNTHLKSLAIATNNQKVIAEIEAHNRLRMGTVPPDIKWENNSLSNLTGADCYVLVFWSSTCSHCLKELPSLHQELKKHPSIKVIAIGLEDNETTWKPETAKLSDFEHVIALGRWNSDYAKLYGIQRTPTYFVLNKDKQIIAKPENDIALINFLEGK